MTQPRAFVAPRGPSRPPCTTWSRGGRVAAGVLVLLLVSTFLASVPTAVIGTASAAGTPVDWGKLAPGPGDTRIGPAPPDMALQVTFALRRDAAGLAAFATSVSEPTSPDYRRYEDVVTLAARFGTSEAAWSAIAADLEARGVHATLDVTRSFAISDMTVGDATALFGTPFSLWKEAVGPPSPGPPPPPSPPALYPDGAPSLPATMVGEVDAVRGLSQWGGLSGTVWEASGGASTTAAAAYPFHPGGGGDPVRTGTPDACAAAEAVTFIGEPAGLAPNQLRTAYGADALTSHGLAGAGATAAVVLDGPAQASDLTGAAACFGAPSIPFFQSNPTGVGGGAGNGEAALDVQMVAAMAPELDRLDMVVPPLTIDPRDDFTFYAWAFAGPLDARRTGNRLPDVISSSMGVCEAAWQLPENQALVPLIEFILAMGVGAGTNWFAAAGDFGPSNCYVVPFLPDPKVPSAVYPSTSPWVTSVGATNLALDPDNAIASSGAWNDLAMGAILGNAGGGGTSTLFTRPAWQRGPGVPNGAMRTVPDVAHMGATFPGVLYLLDGTWTFGDGTSAAAPMTAGMAAVLIGALRADGQERVGSLNPLLYALASDGEPVLRDITIGDTDLFAVGCCAAGPGYDLATGLGSFDLAALTDALRSPAVSLTMPSVVDVGETVTLSASVSLPAGTVTRYDWDLDGDGATDVTTATATATVTVLAGATSPTFTVTAVTDLGRTGSARASARVAAAPSSAAAATPAAPVAAAPHFAG